MVLTPLYIERRNKGGAFICNYPNERLGAYSRAALIKLFSVKAFSENGLCF